MSAAPLKLVANLANLPRVALWRETNGNGAREN
jgi:hypothetical protein